MWGSRYVFFYIFWFGDLNSCVATAERCVLGTLLAGVGVVCSGRVFSFSLSLVRSQRATEPESGSWSPGCCSLQVHCHQEVLVLLWKLMEENPVFTQYVLKNCDINEVSKRRAFVCMISWEFVRPLASFPPVLHIYTTCVSLAVESLHRCLTAFLYATVRCVTTDWLLEHRRCLPTFPPKHN